MQTKKFAQVRTKSMREFGNSLILIGKFVAEKIVRRELNCLFRGDKQDVDGRSTVHAEKALIAIGFAKAIQPVKAV